MRNERKYKNLLKDVKELLKIRFEIQGKSRKVTAKDLDEWLKRNNIKG